MQRLVTFVLFASLLAGSFGQIIKCDNDAKSTTITDVEATFGCSGSYNRGLGLWWSIKAQPGKTRLLSFVQGNICTIGSSHHLSIKQGARMLFRKFGSNNCDISADQPIVLTDSEDVLVYYEQTGSWSDQPRFTIQVTNLPDRYLYPFTGRNQGFPGSASGAGWTYAGFQGYNGSYTLIEVSLNDYRGMSDPILYLQNDKIPTLSRHTVTNTTTCRNQWGKQDCTGYVAVPSPEGGLWTVGVYSTGPYASFNIHPRWVFNATGLPNGGKISKTTMIDEVYQLVVPTNANKLNIKLARMPPGGSSTLYIGTGHSPIQTFDYKLMVNDTAAFDEVTITNPFKAAAHNPGQYLLRIVPTKTVAAGSIFQATWN